MRFKYAYFCRLLNFSSSSLFASCCCWALFRQVYIRIFLCLRMEHWTCNRGLSHYSVNFSSASIHFEGSKIPSVLCIVRTRRALKTRLHNMRKNLQRTINCDKFLSKVLKVVAAWREQCVAPMWRGNAIEKLNWTFTTLRICARSYKSTSENGRKIVINLYSDSVTGNWVEIVALGSFFGCAKKEHVKHIERPCFSFCLGILNFPHISRARSSFQGFIGARRLLRSNVYSVGAL